MMQTTLSSSMIGKNKTIHNYIFLASLKRSVLLGTQLCTGMPKYVHLFIWQCTACFKMLLCLMLDNVACQRQNATTQWLQWVQKNCVALSYSPTFYYCWKIVIAFHEHDRVDGWMDRWVSRWIMDGRMGGHVSWWIMSGWMDGRMCKSMDHGWMSE